MVTITEVAERFFKACETGEGWEGCAGFCTPSATFAAQAAPLAAITSLKRVCRVDEGIADLHAKRLLRGEILCDRRATSERVRLWRLLSATHTGQGGPMPPTGKSTTTDYVYVMQFDDDRICHMTKIWNAPWATKELGWS